MHCTFLVHSLHDGFSLWVPQTCKGQCSKRSFKGTTVVWRAVFMTVQVFPSDNPSSRTDAVMLDNWISRSLEEVEDNLVAAR